MYHSCCRLKMNMIERFFSKYYTPKVEIKDFNVVIDGKFCFNVPVKKQRRDMRKNY